MLKNMSKEELEILSYTDLAELILKEQSKSLNTPAIFKIICDLLEYSDEEYANQIGEFYTSLTTDKRFVFANNEWDLREKHPITIVMEDEDDIEEDEEEESLDEEESLEEDDIETNIEDDDLDDVDDDLDDLSILSDDEMENE